MRVAAIFAALGLTAAPLGAGVQTRAADGRVRIEARAAPLSDVLDDLARQTGMKVTYEGAPPRELITATLDRGTLVEVLLAVFEGLGLTYVIQSDAAGTGVAKLVVVTSGPRGPAAGGPGPGRMGASARPSAPADEPVPEFTEPEMDEDDPELNGPSSVVRDRVVTDPGTGEPYRDAAGQAAGGRSAAALGRPRPGLPCERAGRSSRPDDSVHALPAGPAEPTAAALTCGPVRQLRPES